MAQRPNVMKLVSWEWKDDKEHWHPYEHRISHAIETLHHCQAIQTIIAKKTYQIHRTSATEGLQVNVRSGCKRAIRRIERTCDHIPRWQFPGDKQDWHDFPPETSVDIENLKKDEILTYYTVQGRRYKILKLGPDTAVQENVQTHTKRKLRKVVGNSNTHSIKQGSSPGPSNQHVSSNKSGSSPVPSNTKEQSKPHIANNISNGKIPHHSAHGYVDDDDDDVFDDDNIDDKYENGNKNKNQNKYQVEGEEEGEVDIENEIEGEGKTNKGEGKTTKGEDKEKEIEKDKNKDKDNPKVTDGDDDQNSCVICFEDRRTHILLPCGHFCLCGGCAQTLKECPVCRITVEKIQQVFQP